MTTTNRHPRAHESEARRAQLDALKTKRRNKRVGAHYGPRTVDALTASNAVTLRDVVTELQRISMARVMPTRAVFDLARPATWPKAEALCDQLGVTWQEVADEAGLKLTGKREWVS